mgnify:CR=1 FL=1
MKQETKWPLGRQDHIEVRIISADSRDMFKKCEKFEYDVFLNPLPDQPDVHYISPQPEERITYFDKYPYTEFIAAFLKGDDKRDVRKMKLIGTVRMVYAPHTEKMAPNLFPTVDAAEGIGIYPEKLAGLYRMNPKCIVDVSTMATCKEAKESKDPAPSKALITRAMTRLWELHPIRYGLAMNDEPFHKKMLSRGLPWKDLSPATMYWGSSTIAGIIDFYRVPKGFRRAAVLLYKARGYLTGQKAIKKEW